MLIILICLLEVRFVLLCLSSLFISKYWRFAKCISCAYRSQHIIFPIYIISAPKIISLWRQRYEGNAPLWKRLFNKERVLKEFIEAVPFIDAIERLVLSTELNYGEKFRIIDLACGRGYLSMFLSELLPSDKVERCILVDKQWPMHNAPPKQHHINWVSSWHFQKYLYFVQKLNKNRYKLLLNESFWWQFH